MDIFITSNKSKIRKVKPGDKHFRIADGIMMTDRAYIEITNKCPSNIASLILDAYNRGWIKPVANMTEREMMFLGLAGE